MLYKFLKRIAFLFFGLLWAQKQTLAVFDFSNNGLKNNDIKLLTDRLRVEIVQLGKYEVVERERIDEIFKEQQLQVSGCVDECLIEVGKLLGASRIVLGSIGKVGNFYTINAKLINATSGKVEEAVSYDSKYSIDDLLVKGMNEVSMQLLNLDRKITHVEKKAFPKSNTISNGDLDQFRKVIKDKSKYQNVVKTKRKGKKILNGQISAINQLTNIRGIDQNTIDEYCVWRFGRSLNHLSQVEGGALIMDLQSGKKSLWNDIDYFKKNRNNEARKVVRSDQEKRDTVGVFAICWGPLFYYLYYLLK